MLRFLRDNYKVSNAPQVLFVLGIVRHAGGSDGEVLTMYDGLSRPAWIPISGKHLAVYFGIGNLVSTLLNTGVAADVRDASNRLPLFWAALKVQSEAIEILMSLTKIVLDMKRINDTNPAVHMEVGAIETSYAISCCLRM